MNEIAIKVENLTKIYPLYDHPTDRMKEALHPFKKKYHHEFYALRDVGFEIKEGEIIGIIGKNGAGKSTLLKILTGVLTPSSGGVHVNGRISSLLELGTGFNPELTGMENIYFFGTVNGISKEEMDGKVDEILSFADIGEFVNQPVKTYSSGMFARLAFGVAINIDPEILIVDEVLSVGDVAFQRKCFAKFEQFKKAGITILFVTHSVQQVIEFCDRALLIHAGEKILDGKAKPVGNQYFKMMNASEVNIEEVKQEYKVKASAYTDRLEEVKEEAENKIIEYYDKNLVPKSTVYYKENEVKISDVKVTTLDGEKVNVINQGEKYIYSYDVTCSLNIHNILLGMLIKTTSGFEIGGGNFPAQNKFMSTPASGNFKMVWTFECRLNVGCYFFNAGILSLENNLKHNHRIIDSYMIRVQQNNHHQQQSVGIVDFKIEGEIVR